MRPGGSAPIRPAAALVIAAVSLAGLALLRAPDHDESQYVAAAVLTGRGLIPYRDFAWLQTPLQPLLLAPLTWVLGTAVWPGLRLVSALLGLVALVGVYRAGRSAGVTAPVALAATALFAGCDAFLFGAATARNDMLPLALASLGLAPAVRLAAGTGGRGEALLAGLLFGGAAAAKASYAIPALTFGLWCLRAPRRRAAGWTIVGALPAIALVALFAWIDPAGFRFGAITFPLEGPADFYRDQPAKLLAATKAIDVAKFLALGAAPVALAAWCRSFGRTRTPVERLLDLLILAGLIAAILPTPVWRQYLLPALAPLFVRAVLAWQARPPGRAMRVAAIVFGAVGLAPSLLMLWSYPVALRQAAAVRDVLAEHGIAGPVVTLSPQFLPPATPPDPRFATGPFVFRSRALLDPAAAMRLGVVTRAGPIDLAGRAVLVGGEGAWTAGDVRLDRELARAALAQGYRPVAVPSSGFVLLLPGKPS